MVRPSTGFSDVDLVRRLDDDRGEGGDAGRAEEADDGGARKSAETLSITGRVKTKNP